MEQSENRYQGMTNYETWAVTVWLNRELDFNHYWRAMAEEACREETRARRVGRTCRIQGDTACGFLASQLREEFSEQMIGCDRTSLASELLLASFRRVNWWEVAAWLITPDE